MVVVVVVVDFAAVAVTGALAPSSSFNEDEDGGGDPEIWVLAASVLFFMSSLEAWLDTMARSSLTM